MTNTSQYLLSHPRECGCPGCFARNPQGKYMAFVRHPPPENCDCSVCYVNRNWATLPTSSPLTTCRSTLCTDCRPARWSVVNGRNHVTQAYTCERHKPGSRPPQYWHAVSDTGKPTPFVPLREPFELVGCPSGSVELFGKNIVVDGHCNLWPQISGIFTALMIAVWSLLAVRIVLSS